MSSPTIIRPGIDHAAHFIATHRTGSFTSRTMARIVALGSSIFALAQAVLRCALAVFSLFTIPFFGIAQTFALLSHAQRDATVSVVFFANIFALGTGFAKHPQIAQRPVKKPIVIPFVSISDLNQTYEINEEHLNVARAARIEYTPPPPPPIQDAQFGTHRDPTLDDLLYFARRYFATNSTEYTNLHKLVTQTAGRRISYAMPKNTLEKNKYHEDLERILKHIISQLYHLPIPQTDRDHPGIEELRQLANMATNCAGRWLQEAIEIHEQMNGSITQQSIQDRMQRQMARLRTQVLIKTITDPNTDYEKTEQPKIAWDSYYKLTNPHQLNYYYRLIGTELALPPVVDAAAYTDTFSPGGLSKNDVIAGFLQPQNYGPQAIYRAAFEAFNGTEEDPNTIPKDLIIDWFKENPPQELLKKSPKASRDQNTYALERHELEMQNQNNYTQLTQILKSSHSLQESINLLCNFSHYWKSLSKNQKTELKSRYDVNSQDDAINAQQIEIRAKRAAMNQRTQDGRTLLQVISSYQQITRQLAAPEVNNNFIHDDLIQDYLETQVLEDLGEGKGQRVRPEAILYFLEKNQYLTRKT